MSKCENCIHESVCRIRTYPSQYGLTGDGCGHYKDKSLFVELPVAVGKFVYMPWEWLGQTGIAQLRVMGFSKMIGFGWEFLTDFESDDVGYFDKYNGGRFNFDQVGKTVFLTEEEAERKLSEVGE